MQGTVLTFQPETNTGFISGHDGIRYTFTRVGWASGQVEPKVGLTVDFETDEKVAKHIIVVKVARARGNKSKGTAIVLALLLGGIGAHKFYLGNPVLGVIYLLFVWTFIPAIIALIEGIVYACMSDDDFDRKFNA